MAIPGATPNTATLLVICDLACNWGLDGEMVGSIGAGGSAKTKVAPGQHVVAAATEDGADQVRQVSEVKADGQTVVSIELKPVHDARLKAEQEARDKAAREQTARETQETAAREQQEREQRQREQAALTWTDPPTGLMWAKKDSGSDITWQQATNYCRNLRLANHFDWRLASIEELQGIYDPKANVDGWHVKGNLQLSGWEWSDSQGNAFGEAWGFNFSQVTRYSRPLGSSPLSRALCVRDAG